MKISIVTLGCKTNQAESLSIEKALINSGHEIVEPSGTPDLYIINTCTVTSKADYRSRQLLNRALRKNSKIIVTGCYSELNPDTIKELDDSIVVVKNRDKSTIFNLIDSTGLDESKTLSLYPRHRPIIKVQDGCNYSCSYCAIPKARGISTSVLLEDIINEIVSYESTGYGEVVLTGIHLGTYGLDMPRKKNLSLLLREILKATSSIRVRLSSLEVREITEELLDLISDKRICSHLHIPLQSGDDTILKLMNRHYTAADYRKGVENIAERFPDLAIGTDVIVGFPGEGEKEFTTTNNFIESLPFSYLHIFPYSVRPGTKALSLPHRVPDSIKKDRVAILRETGTSKHDLYIRNNLGRVLKTVIEHECNEGFIGTTDNYIKVLIKDMEFIHAGMLANIHLTEVSNGMAAGVPIKYLEPSNL
jgi:threonylcarbamoyladenosine tRNA methylthiotransferase MtaB